MQGGQEGRPGEDLSPWQLREQRGGKDGTGQPEMGFLVSLLEWEFVELVFGD